jgi:hypothetical protein
MHAKWKLSITAAMASIALPMAAPGPAGADTTLVLFEHDTQQNFVDNHDPGPSPGDQFLFVGDVFDRPGGVLLGTTAGVCTTISGDETAGQTSCNATFNLAGGQIVVQGLADTVALLGRGDACAVAVMGGTGMYRNASGDGTIQVLVDSPNQSDANFVLNVTG